MRFVFFSHSLLSDWSHRSAHFLRGVVSELAERGHRVCVFEPVDAWSVQNLVHEDGLSMQKHMRTLLSDPDAGRELALRGRESILARRTCAHRVDELLAILESLAGERSPGSRRNVSLGVFL